MAKYLAIAKALLIEFRVIKIKRVGGDLNSHVDSLEGLVSIFEEKTRQTIAVDLILIPIHETHQEYVLRNFTP